jgi:hypothetical protein
MVEELSFSFIEVLNFSDVMQIELHIAAPSVPGPSRLEKV